MLEMNDTQAVDHDGSGADSVHRDQERRRGQIGLCLISFASLPDSFIPVQLAAQPISRSTFPCSRRASRPTDFAAREVNHAGSAVDGGLQAGPQSSFTRGRGTGSH